MGLFKRKKKEDKKDKEQLKKVDKVVDEKKDKDDKKIPTQKVGIPTETSGKGNKKSKDKKKDNKEEHGKHDHGQAYKNLIRPIITEKVSFLGMYNQYVFEVDPKSNKVEIKKAIEKLYGVKPIKINIINMQGKNVRYGRKMGKLKSWKKAIITLKQEDKIDVYEGV